LFLAHILYIKWEPKVLSLYYRPQLIGSKHKLGNKKFYKICHRTHSRERKKDEMGLDDDAGYDTMNGRLRRYKDEEALDLAADDMGPADYDYDTLVSML
jgi:hypothetical protein